MQIENFQHRRGEVLGKLWEIALWHEEKRLNNKTQLDQKLEARSALATKEIRAYTAIIQGMHDEEIEIKYKELLAKIENSIIVPKPQPETIRK